MVTAESNTALPRGRPCDTHGQSEGFTTAARVTHLPRPRVQFEQRVRQLHFVRRCECSVAAEVHATLHCRVHLVIRMTKENRAHASGEVRVAPTIKVPNISPFGS